MESSHDVLTDRFGRMHDYLRVSITDRCNFRCLYCMPEEGVEWQPKESLLTFEEIESLVRLFVNLGVRKIRITGGEPTIRKNYLELISRLSKIPLLEQVALTTNGYRLAQDADQLLKAGISQINVSLDTLKTNRFEQITHRKGLSQVLKGIDRALALDIATKVNVVVLPEVNEDEIADFVEMARDQPLVVRFIEFMPFLQNGWTPTRVITSQELRDRLSESYHLVPYRLEPNSVATEFTIDGFLGRIGFVSSVTESFCGGCNRIRLTADGQLKSCLFLPPSVSLRDMLRVGASNDDISLAIFECLRGKWKEHPPMRSWEQRDHLTMVQIGG